MKQCTVLTRPTVSMWVQQHSPVCGSQTVSESLLSLSGPHPEWSSGHRLSSDPWNVPWLQVDKVMVLLPEGWEGWRQCMHWWQIITAGPGFCPSWWGSPHTGAEQGVWSPGLYAYDDKMKVIFWNVFGTELNMSSFRLDLYLLTVLDDWANF